MGHPYIMASGSGAACRRVGGWVGGWGGVPALGVYCQTPLQQCWLSDNMTRQIAAETNSIIGGAASIPNSSRESVAMRLLNEWLHGNRCAFVIRWGGCGGAAFCRVLSCNKNTVQCGNGVEVSHSISFHPPVCPIFLSESPTSRPPSVKWATTCIVRRAPPRPS